MKRTFVAALTVSRASGGWNPRVNSYDLFSIAESSFDSKAIPIVSEATSTVSEATSILRNQIVAQAIKLVITKGVP